MYDFQTIWSAKICLITCEIGEEIIDIKACEEKEHIAFFVKFER